MAVPAARFTVILLLLLLPFGMRASQEVPISTTNTAPTQGRTLDGGILFDGFSVPAQPIAAGRRLSECQTSDSLLWRLSKGDQTFYIMGTEQVGSSYMGPRDGAVTKAISCADRGYFSQQCAGSNPAVGRFMKHCTFYSPSVQKDSIASRFDDGTVKLLKKALSNLLDLAAPGCEGVAAALRPTIDQISNPNFRVALYPLFGAMEKVLSPNMCGITDHFENSVRDQFSGAGKPTFGLEDVDEICSVMQDFTLEEDVDLAKLIISVYNNPSLSAGAASLLRNLADVVKCGDLVAYEAKQLDLRALPKLLKRVVTDRNELLLKRIGMALSSKSQETLMFSVGLVHLISIHSTTGTVAATGLLALLAENGYVIEQVAANSTLSCEPSNHTEAGASELGLCLAPPFITQPLSCLKSTSVEAEKHLKLSKVSSLGSQRDLLPCESCIRGSLPCTCKATWSNTTAFVENCQKPHDGVIGRVLDADLTWNPMSKHSGMNLSQKTFMSITQGCYPENCDVEFLEKMTLRNWYRMSPNLLDGKVALVPPRTSRASTGTPTENSREPSSSNSMGMLEMWQCVLLAIVSVVVVALCLAAICVVCRGRRKKRAVKSRDQDFDDEEPMLDRREFDQRQEIPLQQPNPVPLQAQPVQMIGQAPMVAAPLHPQYIAQPVHRQVVNVLPPQQMVFHPAQARS
eukprot:TRINITY_DN46109_c0_g1_i1.p1 TRINITY_DN46109_c0_g1~~TRINITY_DN46109_c0_g1_i1.p1  ORF type:complete len:686 (-),score=73.91 TRINITY_DN46109_c0_g1_i1:408-2465(-)